MPTESCRLFSCKWPPGSVSELADEKKTPSFLGSESPFVHVLVARAGGEPLERIVDGCLSVKRADPTERVSMVYGGRGLSEGTAGCRAKPSSKGGTRLNKSRNPPKSAR